MAGCGPKAKQTKEDSANLAEGQGLGSAAWHTATQPQNVSPSAEQRSLALARRQKHSHLLALLRGTGHIMVLPHQATKAIPAGPAASRGAQATPQLALHLPFATELLGLQCSRTPPGSTEGHSWQCLGGGDQSGQPCAGQAPPAAPSPASHSLPLTGEY